MTTSTERTAAMERVVEQARVDRKNDYGSDLLHDALRALDALAPSPGAPVEAEALTEERVREIAQETISAQRYEAISLEQVENFEQASLRETLDSIFKRLAALESAKPSGGAGTFVPNKIHDCPVCKLRHATCDIHGHTDDPISDALNRGETVTSKFYPPAPSTDLGTLTVFHGPHPIVELCGCRVIVTDRGVTIHGLNWDSREDISGRRDVPKMIGNWMDDERTSSKRIERDTYDPPPFAVLREYEADGSSKDRALTADEVLKPAPPSRGTGETGETDWYEEIHEHLAGGFTIGGLAQKIATEIAAERRKTLEDALVCIKLTGHEPAIKAIRALASASRTDSHE